jgi:hypothetical protein
LRVTLTDNLERHDGTRRLRITEHDDGAIVSRDLKRLDIKQHSQGLEHATIIRLQDE